MTEHYLSTESTGSMKKHSGGGLPLADATALLIDEELCLNLRGRSLSCQACAKQCTFGALELSADAVALHAENCRACGACLSACPTGVFRLSDFSPADFLQALKGKKETHLHCSISGGKDEDLHLPCLQLLDARLLAAAFAEGTEIFHLTGLGHCERCHKGNAINHMLATQNRLQQWFGAESAPRMVVAAIPLTEWLKDHHRDEKQTRISRRQFFYQAGMRAVASASHYSTPAVNDDDTSLAPQVFHQTNSRHQRAVEYQSLLATRVSELPWRENEIPWYGRSINDKCNACLACAQRCPSGALYAEQSDAGRGISFEMSLCTDCSLCTQVCPMGAIERNRAKDAADVMAARSMLMYQRYRTCQHCAQGFLPQTEDERLCLTCKNEQALESEWLAQCTQ